MAKVDDRPVISDAVEKAQEVGCSPIITSAFCVICGSRFKRPSNVIVCENEECRNEWKRRLAETRKEFGIPGFG